MVQVCEADLQPLLLQLQAVVIFVIAKVLSSEVIIQVFLQVLKDFTTMDSILHQVQV